MNKNHPDIQKFLDQAKTETAESGETCDLVTFSDFWDEKYSANDVSFSEHAFLGDVGMLLSKNQLNYYQELTSYRGGISFIVKPVKRVIRKLVAFLFLPLVSEQNEINLTVARVMLHLRAYINRDSFKGKQFTLRQQEIETQLRMQRDTIADLTARIEQLEAERKGEKP